MTDDILKFRAQELKDRVLEAAADRDVSLSQWLREATEQKLAADCSECGGCDICGGEVLELEPYAGDPATDGSTATIIGYGRFDETSNPEVQALIERAKELLAIGAVGVSVATDLDPDDLPTNPNEASPEDLPENLHQRIRHTAIVDTPAFSGAYLDTTVDGTLTGPLVFEGIPTGDLRSVGPVGTLTLDDTLLPIPIIFDLQDGDHTGVVVGHIDRWERVSGVVSGEVAPVAASINFDAYPAYLFAEPEATAPTIHAPDKNGYRRYTGIIADANVCHKGRPSGCYKYQAASLDYFHSGGRIRLDNGEYLRVGPLMFGGLHADGTEFNYAKALERANEDARTVFAMGRCFHHPKGLLFSGVLMPDADIPRIQATTPSIEQWPDHRGKLELKTALNVPRGGLPFAASLSGGGVMLVDNSEVIVEEAHGDHHTRLDELAARMDELEKVTGELYGEYLNKQIDGLHGPGAADALDAAIADGSIFGQ